MLKLRWPIWAEIRALFVQPTAVDHVVAGMNRQVVGLDAVQKAQAQAGAHHNRRYFEHLEIAHRHSAEADRAHGEALRADRVRVRLKALLA